MNIAPRLNRIRFALRIWRSRKLGVSIGQNCTFIGGIPQWGTEPFLISVGNSVLISARVTFLTHDGSVCVVRKIPGFDDVIKFGRITIHDNCFIGIGATILPGVEIGPNSIVGAGSIVTKSVPPESVAAGNPARFIMTLEEYARRCKSKMPDYDRKHYASDVRTELLRLFPQKTSD